MKQKSLFVAATAAEAKAAARLDDRRPAGWTEAKALSFIALGLVDPADSFARAFCEGDWLAIISEWPEFSAWISMEGARHGE